MFFKRGDISNLMEKLVGWKSIHIGNEGKYNCNGFEFKFGIRLADGIHKEKRIKIHFTKYKSSTRVVSILRFLVILILCIIWRDVFYTKCNKYCTTLTFFKKYYILSLKLISNHNCIYIYVSYYSEKLLDVLWFNTVYITIEHIGMTFFD